MKRLIFYLLLATVAIAAQPDFTVALLPDIQCITQAGNTPAIFNWIVANRTTCSGAGCPTSGQWNIRAIWSLGDNTQQTSGCSGSTNGHEIADVQAAWDIARTATPAFDSLVPVLGNHDYDGGGTGSEVANRLTTAWNALFTPAWYATLPGNYVADGYPSSSVTDNFYMLPTVGGYPMLVMGLEFYPRNAAVTWGNAILAAHEDRTQIILTHAAISPCGGIHNVIDADQWGPNAYGVGGSSSTNGQELFDNMIKIHRVMLSANGHFIASGTGQQCDGATFVKEVDQLAARTTYSGNVIQIFSDYQQDSSQSLVTLLKFRPASGIVEIYNYDVAGGAMRSPAMHTLAWTPPGAAITSAGSGDWNVTTTWTGGVVPVSGDTVKIGDGHTVTIPAATQAIAGDSGPGGGQNSAGGPVPAIGCASDTGTGTLIVYGTITLRGNVEQCQSTWVVHAGATIEHDSSFAASPSTTHYRWFVGTGNRPVTAKLQVRGASGNRVIIHNATGSGTFYGFTPTLNFNSQDSGGVDFEYATISGCGGSTPCMEGSAYSNAFTMRCDHCLITNSGVIAFNEQAISTASFSLTNTTITAPAGGNHYVATVGAITSSTAAILLDTIYTDGIINFNGTTGTTANNYRVRNVIIRDIANTNATLSNAFRLTEFDRVLRITDQQSAGSTGSYAYIPGGNLTRLMCLMNSSTNPHCFFGPSGVSGQNDSIDGAYMEEMGAGTDGDSILGASGPATLTTIKNVVMACNATTGSSMSLSSTGIPSPKTFSLLNNTYCGKDDGNARGFGFEDANPANPSTAAVGMLAAARNNIVFCASNIPCYLVHKGPTGTAQAGTYQNVDYNWQWNVSTGPYFDNTGGKYSPAPGTHDSTGDPQFVQQRHFLDWGQSLKPAISTWTDIVAEFAKMNDDSGFDSRFTILNAYNWLRAGYQPQNAAVLTAGDTGGQVGALGLAAGITNVTVIGVTNTQATIAYTAPDAGVCAIELSESSSYTSPVHDVDGSLFTGSDFDDRATSLGAGTLFRAVVFGSMVPQAAGSGTVYSRALQTNTLHYYRITCGTAVVTGTFSTANIPVGNTYNEPPVPNPAVPGDWLLPTIDGTRTQKIVDPYTGALLSPVSLQIDQVGGQSGSYGTSIYGGAGPRACNPVLHTDSVTGLPIYLCNLDGLVGWYNLFGLIPSTGEARHLGVIPLQGSSHVYVDDSLHAFAGVTRYDYVGNYAERVGGINEQPAQLANPLTYLPVSLGSLVQNFDATFDPTKYGCSGVSPEVGKYAGTVCKRGQQDSYGWLAVFYAGDGRVVPSSCAVDDTGCPRIVAAWNSYIKQSSKFCGIHEVEQSSGTGKGLVPGNNLMAVNWHGLDTNPPHTNTAVGTAAIFTTAAVQANAGTNTITVSGAPASRMTGGDPVPAPTVTAGDRIQLVGVSNPAGLVIASVNGNTWTLTSNLAGTLSAGSEILMRCNAPPSENDSVWSIAWWDFLNDPAGDSVIFDTKFPGGGHYDTGPIGRVSEAVSGDAFVKNTGTLLNSLNTPITTINASASFAGITPPAFGNLTTRHPSWQQATNSPWFFDRIAFAGGDPSSATGRWYSATVGATLISGNLYQYFVDSTYPLSRKRAATQATSGSKSLLDISSPAQGDQIGDTGADNYKYCVAYVAGECRAGSSAGNIYFNVPTLTFHYCTGGGAPNPRNIDICITDMPPYSGTMMQYYMGTDSTDSQRRSRNITGGLAPPKFMFSYPLAKSTPGEEYGLFTYGLERSGGVGTIDVWKAKLPPLPAPDGVDRMTFVPYSVSLTATVGLGVTYAALKFGYTDQGTASQYYCTSRRESCVANLASVSQTTPFQYLTTDTWTGLTCATSCTIVLPLLPGHIAYYQPVYLDAGGSVVSTGPVGVAGDWMTPQASSTFTTYTGTSRMGGVSVLK